MIGIVRAELETLKFAATKEMVLQIVRIYTGDDGESHFEDIEIPLLEIRKEVQDEQHKALDSLRASRNNEEVEGKLAAITNASHNSENLLPLIIEAAKSYATLGEIVDSMKVVFGEWQEAAVI